MSTLAVRAMNQGLPGPVGKKGNVELNNSKSHEKRRFWIPLLLGVSLGVNCVLFMQPPPSGIAFGDAATGTNGFLLGGLEQAQRVSARGVGFALVDESLANFFIVVDFAIKDQAVALA